MLTNLKHLVLDESVSSTQTQKEIQTLFPLLDKFLGSYCFILIAGVILNRNNPAINFPWALTALFIFLGTNVLWSQLTLRFQRKDLLEIFRNPVAAISIVPLFFFMGGSSGNFFYPFQIMVLGGCAASYIAIRLKPYIVIGFYSCLIVILVWIDVGNLRELLSGDLLFELGLLFLIGMYTNRLLKFFIDRDVLALKSNNELKDANIKLSEVLARKKELSVSEKKKSEELHVANQQLRASEQQLKASNLQLAANEQTLRWVQDELEKKVSDLQRFNKLMVGREMDMIKLKEEVNSLLEESGRQKKYKTS